MGDVGEPLLGTIEKVIKRIANSAHSTPTLSVCVRWDNQTADEAPRLGKTGLGGKYDLCLGTVPADLLLSRPAAEEDQATVQKVSALHGRRAKTASCFERPAR